MKRCIFCTGAATTLEHAWPDWLLQAVRTEHVRVEAQFGPGMPTCYWGGSKAEQKIRCVCTTCNSGWMSELEHHAKSVLSPLMWDISFGLDRKQQAIVAVWSVKTAMVFEHISRTRPHFYSQEEREGLRQSLCFPEETTIWIGRYAQSNALLAESHLLSNPKEKNSVFNNAVVVTFAIQRLVIQVLCLRHKSGVQAGRYSPMQTKRLGRYLHQIWPIDNSATRWPPSLSFSDSGVTLDDLSTRFSRSPG
jgi:hypothetical protein